MANAIRKKMVIVGDGNCGKTCILMVYKEEDFLEMYVPTVFESYVFPVPVNGIKVDVTLTDTAGQEEYDRLRPLTYPGTDVVILVFSIDNPDSLANIEHRWSKEIKHHLPNVPVVLVGNKKDLRDDPVLLEKLRKLNTKPVSHAQGMQASATIKAYQYLECSAKTNSGVKEVIEAATKASMGEIARRKARCSLL